MTVEQSYRAAVGGHVPGNPPVPRAQRRAWLAKRILDQLVLANATAGSHVTELALADALGVSRSPVRAALKLLADHGVLNQRPNRGFFLSKDVRVFDSLMPSDENAPEDQLYFAILNDRLAERIFGVVTQVELARRYDAPESRVASVLARLREEGIVRRNPGRGWTFQPAINTPEALAHSYALRLAVEPAGLRLPGFAVDGAALDLNRRRHEKLLGAAVHDPMIRARAFELDASFHEMLAGFSGNPYFLEAVQTQNRLRRMVELVEYSNRARIALWIVEHIGVLDALAAGRTERASTLLAAHLTRASQNVGRRDN